MNVFRSLYFILSLALFSSPAGATELKVFAAASLADALQEIASEYTKISGDALSFNLGSSGMLARQIKEGAPADLFFSADELHMDQLEGAGLIVANTRRALLRNTLVLVVATSTDAHLTHIAELERSEIHRIAIGQPAIVPAGTYAKEYLEKIKLWSPLQPKLVSLENVRAVLSVVEAGNADAGFVYKTDALISKKVRIAVQVPSSEGPRIIYPIAMVKDSKSPDAARAFIKYLSQPQAQAIFARFGFLPVHN